MNKNKLSNPVRLIAFFLTALLLICTFGFTADGWQIGDEAGKGQNQDIQNPLPENSTEEENDNNANDNNSDQPEIYIPEYTNKITGVEVSGEEAKMAHFAFIMNGDLPCYGISGADLICEIPTEDGTRLVAFIPENVGLWKSGSIAPARGYISNIAKYFGGVCISYGCDDSISYTQCDTSGTLLDLSHSNKYHYTEFSSYVYTNSDLLSSAISESGINLDLASQALPYSFPEYGKEPIIYGDKIIEHVRIAKSESDFNEIYFNKESGMYTINKNGTQLTDMVNGKQPEFTNCFILFADSVIYDNSKCSQMVMDTIGSGVGYYLSAGGMCEIKWSAASDGKMTFTDVNGNLLTVNRGRVYISFLKSSMSDKLIFE